MKSTRTVLLVGLLSLAYQPARADEPPYLDFVRSLREKRRAPDLALEYSQDLSKEPDLTAAERRALNRDKRLAQFELGANLFHKANTLTDDAARSVTIGQARDVLKKLVASSTDKDSLYYENVAWLARCYAETDDPKNAETQFSDIFCQKCPESEPGKRLAQYFRLQFMERDPSIKPEARPKIIETEASNWLNTYKEYDSSPEGYAVRFL